MKNTFKKFTAVLLVTLLIVVSVPVQSFALFDSFRIPIIKSIEFADKSQTVSLKELDNYYNEIFLELEDFGISLDELIDKYPSLYSGMLSFYLYSSNFDYDYVVTLSTGKKYTVSAEDVQLNKIYSVEAEGKITYENYLKAKESGADEIEIEIIGYLYNNLTYEANELTEYVTTSTLPVVDMVVKSVTPISGVPDKIYADADYDDMEGAMFRIEYADGTVTTAEATLSEAFDGVFYDTYNLDGNTLVVWNDTESEEDSAKYCFEYLDAYFEKSAELSETSLFKSIKITNCDFDIDTAVLKSISYEITYQDGRVLSFSEEFTEEDEELLILGKELEFIDGYIVYVSLNIGGYDIFSDKINAETFDIEVSIGENSDVYKVDIPYKELVNGIVNIYFFFENIIEKIQDTFYNIIDLIFFPFFILI